MTPIKTLERLSLEVEFADEAEARRYLEERLAEGFLPAAPTLTGILAHHYTGTRTTWTVLVEKQVYNGEPTPGYQKGDRVRVTPPLDPPEEGTVTHVYGHRLKVQLGATEYACLDYEVSRAG